jgi:hypothetical protein
MFLTLCLKVNDIKRSQQNKNRKFKLLRELVNQIG